MLLLLGKLVMYTTIISNISHEGDGTGGADGFKPHQCFKDLD